MQQNKYIVNSCKRFAASLCWLKMGPKGGRKETSQRNNYKAFFCKNNLDLYFMASFVSILSVSGLVLHKNKIWDIVKRKKLELFFTEKPIPWRTSWGETDISHLKIQPIIFQLVKRNYFKSCQSQNLRERLK